MTIPQQPLSTPPHATPGSASDQAALPLIHEFIAAGPIDLNIQNLRGGITLRAELGTTVRVELSPHGEAARQLVERMTVRFTEERLVVDVPSEGFGHVGADVGGFFRSFGTGNGASLSDRIAVGVRSLVRGAEGLGGQLDITVVVPTGSRAVVGDGAGDVRIAGGLGRLEARTGAGELTVERGADQRNRLTTGTGNIRVGASTGDLTATTGTGDVLLDRIDGHVAATAGVGDVLVRHAGSGHLTARTGLGDVTVHVAPGTAARLDLATGLGSRDVQLTPADGAGAAERTVEIEAKSGKGDLRILRAVG